MRRHRVRLPFVASLSALVPIVGVCLAFADDSSQPSKGIDAKVAYAKLKAMAGTWKSAITHEAAASSASNASRDHHLSEASVDFKLTGAGSAVVETQFPGQAHEMVSVYHLDYDDLRMTHYCAAGNQPRLKLDRIRSKPDHLVFAFDGGSNLNPQKDHHIHELEISFLPDGRVLSEWKSFADGQKAETSVFTMTRQP